MLILKNHKKLKQKDSMSRFEGIQIGELMNDTNRMFKIVFERLNDLDSERPSLPNKRLKIGLRLK